MASTVKERGHVNPCKSLAFRSPAGERDRWRGSGLGSIDSMIRTLTCYIVSGLGYLLQAARDHEEVPGRMVGV